MPKRTLFGIVIIVPGRYFWVPSVPPAPSGKYFRQSFGSAAKHIPTMPAKTAQDQLNHRLKLKAAKKHCDQKCHHSDDVIGTEGGICPPRTSVYFIINPTVKTPMTAI